MSHSVESYDLTNLVPSYKLSNYTTFWNLDECFIIKHCFIMKHCFIIKYCFSYEMLCLLYPRSDTKKLLTYGDEINARFGIIISDNFDIYVFNYNNVICELFANYLIILM